ncbi:MAG TPA: hypothetical protein VEB22_02270 [Phycisphaerales bacterium]|nr:hypothetical protein [Phycisphaerales bacterium]
MRTTFLSLAACVCAAAALGQPPAQTPPAAPPSPPASPRPAPPGTSQPLAAPAKTEPPPTLPSLDEALGLAKPGEKPEGKKPNAKPPGITDDLQKALSGEKPGDELQRAVALMEQSAGRLEKAKDTSLETQRVQEETVRLLDALIKKSSQKQNPRSNQQKPQDQQQNQQQQPNQSQQSQAQQRPQDTPDPNDTADRGGNPNAQLRPGIEAARAAWGNLPQRVRQLLMQGSGDQFSKEYQRLTEEYYKRLGEQGN